MWQEEMTETVGKWWMQMKNRNFQNFCVLKCNDVQSLNCKGKELLTFAFLRHHFSVPSPSWGYRFCYRAAQWNWSDHLACWICQPTFPAIASSWISIFAKAGFSLFSVKEHCCESQPGASPGAVQDEHWSSRAGRWKPLLLLACQWAEQVRLGPVSWNPLSVKAGSNTMATFKAHRRSKTVINDRVIIFKTFRWDWVNLVWKHLSSKCAETETTLKCLIQSSFFHNSTAQPQS